MNLDAKIYEFFRDPTDVKLPPGFFSNLYLLRRDILTCFGFDPNNGKKIEYQALVPGAMAIFAGIDLVAKFVYGDRGGVSRRFRKYLIEYMDITFWEGLYQLRNSLIHSFGFYSEGRPGETYRFVIARGDQSIIKRQHGDVYAVYIDGLKNAFEKSLSKYEEKLRLSTDLQSTFLAMSPKYNGVWIG